MRRSATACETAHCIVPPAGVIERPSAALQKVVVALLFSKFASACTLPAMRVASGDHAQPHHLGVEAHRHIYGIVSRQKQKRIALRPKLVVLLHRIYGIDLLLDHLGRHRRIEDQYIRAELRFPALRCNCW